MMLIPVLFISSQPKTTAFDTVTFHMDETASTFFNEKYRDTARIAYKIVSAVFNSSEFQTQLKTLTFRCDSYAAGCGILQENGGRIPGNVILQMLLKSTDVTDTLHVIESGGALGDTNVGHNETNTYYKQILADMPELPFTYSLAVNICHEYMHSLGFHHLYCSGPNPFCRHLKERNGQPDPYFYKEDVTYRIGWMAYEILKRKFDNHQTVY